MKKYIYFLIPVYALYIFGMFYVMLPPLNWHAPAFWKFLALSVGPLLVLLIDRHPAFLRRGRPEHQPAAAPVRRGMGRSLHPALYHARRDGVMRRSSRHNGDCATQCGQGLTVVQSRPQSSRILCVLGLLHGRHGLARRPDRSPMGERQRSSRPAEATRYLSRSLPMVFWSMLKPPSKKGTKARPISFWKVQIYSTFNTPMRSPPINWAGPFWTATI